MDVISTIWLMSDGMRFNFQRQKVLRVSERFDGSRLTEKYLHAVESKASTKSKAAQVFCSGGQRHFA